MLALTKMRHIKKHKLEEVKKYDWRELFKNEIEKYSKVGITLKGFRAREELTQKKLAAILGISQHHISEMENGKRSISKKMAIKFGKILKTNYRLFL